MTHDSDAPADDLVRRLRARKKHIEGRMCSGAFIDDEDCSEAAAAILLLQHEKEAVSKVLSDEIDKQRQFCIEWERQYTEYRHAIMAALEIDHDDKETVVAEINALARNAEDAGLSAFSLSEANDMLLSRAEAAEARAAAAEDDAARYRIISAGEDFIVYAIDTGDDGTGIKEVEIPSDQLDAAADEAIAAQDARPD